MQARTQRFTLGTPKEIRVAPDGSRVLFLRSPSGEERRHSLWQLDLATGEESVLADPAGLLADGDEELSAEERARRERARQQASGIVGNATDAAVRIVAFALSGRLYVTDTETGETRLLDTPTPVVDPRPDPTGTHVAYVSGNALRVARVDGTGDWAIAEPEGEDRAYGLAEFIAAEEMNRSRGYWWSPDGTRLLVSHTDRSEVHRWHISDPANPAAAPNVVHYPAAGTPNVKVQLFVFALDGSRVPVDWTGSEYLASVHWSAGGPPLISVQTRDQRTMRTVTVNPDNGGIELLHEETDPHWVDIVTGVPAWTPDGRLVRVAVAGGAYRLVVDGKEITGLPLQVRSVLDAGDDIMFTASASDPTQVHVYTAGSAGVHCLSTEDGVHSATRSGAVTVLTSWRSSAAGPKVTVLSGAEVTGEVRSFAVTPPIEPNVIPLTLGARELRGALMFPAGHEPGTKLPVLLDPYGGPHAQRVLASRNAYLTSQWLADQGFAVLVIDGRGTPGRGPDWERAVAFDLADVTLMDQVEGLHAAAAQYPDLDLSRVGIRGWSYGGYLSALAVLRRPDVFHAAIAGAPVTDWRLYDTHYTERYLGHPENHPDVYARNSLPAEAPNLERPLMIIHGLADDNVVVAHSLRLSAALVAAGRPHTLLPLPGVTHMTPQDDETAENFLLLQTTWLRDALGIVR
ncbi:MAG: prolyl oligopeptidase family serine peptidase [Kibdelosporangium sp.]